MSQPTTASAWQIIKKGSFPAVLAKRDIALPPKLKPTEVLIKVSHAGLNPVDYKLAALVPSFVQKLPRTAAADVAGTVVALGSATLTHKYDWLQVDVPVFGSIANLPPTTPHGALATYTVVDASRLQPIPRSDMAREAGVSAESLAGAGIVATTAWAQVKHVKQGDRVFINGGTSAVGLYAAELALLKGASLVVATASGAKGDALKQRGVHELIDHRAVDLQAELTKCYASQPLDVVLDCIGVASLHLASPAFLKEGGKWINIGASSLTPDSSVLGPQALSILSWNVKAKLPRALGGHARALVQTGADFGALEEVRKLFDEGKFHPLVDKTFAFEDAPKAYEYLIAGRALGKVIVAVSP